ncbi:MAG: DUF3737 family protein [Ruminococcus sp.]|nr:DUF3737 family protein [Ruminococcus sp.]
MGIIENQKFDEERALYGSHGVIVRNCSFDGPADGESALKESSDIEVYDCFCNLRYPFWHDHNLRIENCEMTELCRAALWYSDNISISGTKMHGIKALRECSGVSVEDCHIISPEFGWSVDGITMKDSTAVSEYFMMRSRRINFENVEFQGKYSFQYIEDAVFENCNFNTKDAFWHGKNIIVRNSIVKGEYLAWYSENLTLENCHISGTQPFCYCKNLKLVNCVLDDADLCFEKSDVNAEIKSHVISIKNPASGTIKAESVGEIIMTDENAHGEIVTLNQIS